MGQRDWCAEPSTQNVFELSNDNATEYCNVNGYISGAYALCAMKTMTNGCFYVPNPTYVNATRLRVEMLFTNGYIVGDQTGGASPYPAITNYPDGTVDTSDTSMVASAFGSREGQTGWNYIADVVPDRIIDISDLAAVAANFGKSGSYSSDLTGVQVVFNVGGSQSPDEAGFVAIPTGATTFNITQNGVGVGAMIVFCAS